MRISYSSLETYKNCPQKYKFQEIDKIKAKKSKEAVFGTAIHSALQYMFSRDPLFPTLDEVLSNFKTTITNSPAIADDIKKRYEDVGDRMIRQYYQKNPPWNFTVIDLESRFEVALDDPKSGKNHILVGKIDRIDKPDEETYEIIDYKTSSKLPSQATVDGNLQLSLYQLGLHRRWPHIEAKNVRLALYFLKAGEKLSTTRSEESLRTTESSLLSDIRTIEEKTTSGDFPPLVSPLCNWCSYKPLCPAWKHLYSKTKDPKTQKTGEELAQEYVRLKSEISEREQTLKKLATEINAYLTEHGLERIFGDTHVLARKIQERSTFDIEKLRLILEPQGLWESVLAPDQKQIKKLLPSLPEETQEQLKEAIIIKRFSLLGLSKRKIDDHQSEDLIS